MVFQPPAVYVSLYLHNSGGWRHAYNCIFFFRMLKNSINIFAIFGWKRTVRWWRHYNDRLIIPLALSFPQRKTTERKGPATSSESCWVEQSNRYSICSISHQEEMYLSDYIWKQKPSYTTPCCRYCLVGNRQDQICSLRAADGGTGSCVDLLTASTFAEIQTHMSLRLADKGDTSSWRAGKTEKILSNIDLS